MKQINNGFANYYYLSEDGQVYNSQRNKYVKPQENHQFKLRTETSGYKSISLKNLYKKVYNKNFCEDTLPDLSNEEWRVIKNTNSLYHVSSLGRVKSYQGYNAIILKPFYNDNGYLRVEIVQDGKKQTKLVHRLVAAAFLPMPEDIDYQLHHINGNRFCNASDNLQWLSPSDHKKIHLLMNRKEF